MKPIVGALLLMPVLAVASGPGSEEDPFPSGVAGGVVAEKPRTYTGQMLETQSKSGGAKASELAAPVFVESQKRLLDSFTRPIPDSFDPQTRNQGAR